MRKLRVEELNRPSIDEFKNTKKNAYVVILDDVRSMHNVGATFRTADGFLADKVYLCGITAKPPHRDIHKTALGAEDSVEWEHREDVREVVGELRESGYNIICVEQVDESISLQKFKPSSEKKYAFIFGNEAFGVNDKVLEEADLCVEIPQYGTKHSLNISISVGIVLWDYMVKTKL